MKSHVVKPVPAVDQAGEHVLPGMLLHQVEPPGPIDLAGHGLAHRQRAVAAVYDDAISLLHRQNLGVCQGAQVPGLSAAFGIKCRLVQANGPASGCRTALRDLRGEVTQMGILVKKGAGVHEMLLPASLYRGCTKITSYYRAKYPGTQGRFRPFSKPPRTSPLTAPQDGPAASLWRPLPRKRKQRPDGVVPIRF